MVQPRLGEQLAQFAPHSYRADRAVPAYDDSRPLIVFDGVCVLCSGFARFVMRHDRQARFRLTPSQSPLGRGLLAHYGIDPDNPETNLLIAAGRPHGKLDAFVRIMGGLGWLGLLALPARMLPGRLADFLYDRIARNRYRLVGRSQVCMAPPARWTDRIIE